MTNNQCTNLVKQKLRILWDSNLDKHVSEGGHACNFATEESDMEKYKNAKAYELQPQLDTLGTTKI